MKSSSLVRPFFFVALPITILLVLLIYVGIEMYAHLTTASRFSVRHVEVITDGPEKKEIIAKLANVKMGANIFALDLVAIRKNVEKDPWAASATITRELPDTIQVRYQPQVPVAILGMDSLYYLNKDGVPFYRIAKGDSLDFPFIHVDASTHPQDLTKERILGALQLLNLLKHVSWLGPKDLGDITVRQGLSEMEPPYLVTVNFPPTGIVGKMSVKHHYFTMSFAAEDLEQQVKRAELVLRNLVQAGKNPRLIRFELGKKIVVKLDQSL